MHQRRVPFGRKSVPKRQKCAPFSKTYINNAYPEAESRRRNEGRPLRVGGGSGSKMRTPRQQVRQTCVLFGRKSSSMRQKRGPSIKQCVNNADPREEIKVIDVTGTGLPLELWGAILNPLSVLLFHHPRKRQSGCITRLLASGHPGRMVALPHPSMCKPSGCITPLLASGATQGDGRKTSRQGEGRVAALPRL